jgi:hypothetical protein
MNKWAVAEIIARGYQQSRFNSKYPLLLHSAPELKEEKTI